MKWTPEQYEWAKFLRATGMAWDKIGEQSGRSGAAVRDFVLKNPIFPTYLLDDPWPPERLAKLKECIAAGYSGGQAGYVLGCSRAAAIGKAYRMEQLEGGSDWTWGGGVPGKPTRTANGSIGISRPNGPNVVRARRKRASAQPREPKAYYVKPRAPKPQRVWTPQPHLDLPTELSAPLLSLPLHHACRWPVGDAPRGEMDKLLMCGAYAETGPYCPHHAAKSVSGKDYVAVPRTKGVPALDSDFDRRFAA